MRSQFNYVIGIDEVGRGPLAGPVVVAALALPKNLKYGIRNTGMRLRDSKKLSVTQREKWFKLIKQKNIPYALARVSPKVIDRINISRAANLAAVKAFKRLITNYKVANYKIFLDGGLYLNKISNFGFQIQNSKTVVKGDELIPAISLASIVAKVTRDRYMVKLSKKYPYYWFKENKGYGTKKHIAAIKKYGLSDIHRLTFVKKYNNLKTSVV